MANFVVIQTYFGFSKWIVYIWNTVRNRYLNRKFNEGNEEHFEKEEEEEKRDSEAEANASSTCTTTTRSLHRFVDKGVRA